MEIGRITSISITCKDCKKVFVMGRGGSTLVLQHGVPTPEKVPELQEEKEGGERACEREKCLCQ